MREKWLLGKALVYGLLSILFHAIGLDKLDNYFWSLRSDVEEILNQDYPES